MSKKATEVDALSILRVLDSISSKFEIGCEIKIDNTEKLIDITGYDELDRDSEQYDGGCYATRVRHYQAQVWIDEEEGSIGSDIGEVLNTIEKDTERMLVCRKKVLP